MTNRVPLVVGGVVIIVGLVVLLLSTGGPGANAKLDDEAGDVIVGRGSQPPRNLELADIREIDVRSRDGVVTFQARMGGPLVKRPPAASAAWQWEIYESENLTWLVSASVNVATSASIIATQTEFSATSIDGSLPGEVSIEGDRVVVRLETAELEDFPESFETVLKTTLDASRSEASSALAEDRAPQTGTLRVGG